MIIKSRNERQKARKLDLKTGDRPVQQQHREGVHIDTIVARYRQTQEWNHINPKSAMYTEGYGLDHNMTLQEAFDQVDAHIDRFMQLDAEIRKAAGNDPVQFREMLLTEEGMTVLEDAGLAVQGRPSEQNYLRKEAEREKREAEEEQRMRLPEEWQEFAQAAEAANDAKKAEKGKASS